MANFIECCLNYKKDRYCLQTLNHKVMVTDKATVMSWSEDRFSSIFIGQSFNSRGSRIFLRAGGGAPKWVC